MVLKRQLPSRVAPDAPGAKPAETPASTLPASIDEQWPAPPAEKPAAPAAELPPLPSLPVFPAEPMQAEVPIESAPVEQPVVPQRPERTVDTTPSAPSADMPRRRVKTARSFSEKPAEGAAVAEASAAIPAAAESVAKPIAEAPDRLADAGLIASPKADALVANQPPSAPSIAAPVASAEPENIFAVPSIESEAPVEAAAPVAALPEPASDLPWASTTKADSGSGWDIDTPTPAQTPVAAAPSAPPPDVFGDVAVSRSPAEGPLPSMHWSSSGNGRPPPELPQSSIAATPRGGSFQLVLAAAAVAGVLFVAYTLVTRTDSTQERLARLTGSLREAPEVVPGSPSSTNPAVRPNLHPEQVVAMDNLSTTLLPPPEVAGGPANTTFMPLEPTKPGVSPSTLVDFTDVPPGEAGKPIVADGTEKMPSDVGFIASLQQAIAKEKAKGGQPAAITEAETTTAESKDLTTEQKLQRGADLKAQLDEELAAYRKALADAPAPALAPKPTEFFKEPKQFMDGKNQLAAAANASGTLLPPPANNTAAVSAKGNVEGLPPAELYAHNPKNLPILPEPAVDAPKVRQLTDFDVNVFEPEEPKVRIPKGVKPQIAAGDFPTLDILSLVPGRGLIAYYEGKEGVLMVGERIAGWKLLSVNATSAEFSSGERRQRVRAD